MKQFSSNSLNFACRTLRRPTLLSLVSLVCLVCLSAQAENKITISGISSGGFMASQMGTTYSSQIAGVGTIAGGFFYCAQNHMQDKIEEGKKNLFLGMRNLFLFEASSKFRTDVVTGQAVLHPNGDSKWATPSLANPIYEAVGVCMQNPAAAKLPDLQNFEKLGLIDLVENLKSQQIYIYQGEADTVVGSEMAQRLSDFYLDNHVDSKQIKTKTLPGGHNFPTDKKGLNDCKNQSMPYVSSCKFNLAEDMLQHLLRKRLTRTKSNLNNLYRIDQNLEPINETLEQINWKTPAPSLAAYGYLYASKSCLENPSTCQVHVALHGCEMSDSFDRKLDEDYQRQVSQSLVLYLMDSKKDALFWSDTLRPSNDERSLSYGTLRFAMLSGYIELAEKNNLMVLFPQTWVSSQNYPYNPKGCWDWFGANDADYATNKGIETSWLMRYINAVQLSPKKYILSTRPDFDKVEN